MHVDRAPDRPTVDEVEWLVAEYYAIHLAGGNLHIVLDDCNIEDGSVDFCIEYARRDGDVMGEVLGHALRAMSPTQRGKLANHRRPPHGCDEWHERKREG